MKFNVAKRAQSAMEYLATYGWAILIIGVVLAALFSLGVFGSTGLLGTTCIAGAGYVCSSPLLHSGNFIVTVGQATGTSWTTANTEIYYIGSGMAAGCTSTMSNTIVGGLASGASTTVTFGGNTIYLPSALGASATGALWAGYNTATTGGLCVQIATVTLRST
jgi:hypothetical protein